MRSKSEPNTMRPIGEIAAEVIAKTRQQARAETDRDTERAERAERKRKLLSEHWPG
jgi:hypothetical protein